MVGVAGGGADGGDDVIALAPVNPIVSSPGSHRRPLCSMMQVGSVDTRPRARFAFEG